MSETERENFLVEGVKHYGEAYDAIVHFRGEFQQRLKDILTHKTNWKIFVPKKRNAVETEVRKHRGEYWICATVAGQIGVQPARISIGGWWHPVDFPTGEDPIIYVHVVEPSALARFDCKGTSNGIRARDDDRWSYLYICPNDSLDIDQAFNQLLDELQQLLVKSKKVE